MKKTILFVFFGLFMLLLGLSGVTYSFVNNIGDNGIKNSSAIVKDDDITIVYENGTELLANYLKDNESISKSFTVKNTSFGAISYNILWSYINNNYTNKEGLTYTLKEESGKNLILDTVVPITSANVPIVKNIVLEKNETKKYILEVKYSDNNNIKEKDQTLNGKVSVLVNEE